jgi:gamma-glutamylcyclotransferase (GGCT)/AIG2-like uncharacterized protein YtfP
MQKHMTIYLFSYGTLQLERVQLETFGRLLYGTADALPGYKMESVEIKDADVLAKSALAFHPIAIPTGNNDDKIDGVVFEITAEELAHADAYEVSSYKRISVTLESGKTAWTYVSAEYA